MRPILIGLFGFTGCLFSIQHKLIWSPQHYGAEYKEMLPKRAVELRYSTTQGKQCVLYIPPRKGSAGPPARLWVLCGGNGSLALDWTNLVLEDPNRQDGFLLIDYPGFGNCEGSAEPGSISESMEKAMTELATHLHTTPDELDRRLNVLGHSIGCAVVLEFACRHPVHRVVLLAPFTSLRDMAQKRVGWPLCYLLLHNFDNRARLGQLAGRPEPPRVAIFHGKKDEVIPERMGRELANMYPKMIMFHEVPEASHNSIADDAEMEIYSAMND